MTDTGDGDAREAFACGSISLPNPFGDEQRDGRITQQVSDAGWYIDAVALLIWGFVFDDLAVAFPWRVGAVLVAPSIRLGAAVR